MKKHSVLLMICFLTACVSKTVDKESQTPVAPLVNSKNSFIVMTYNIENLFDTKHDEGKEDYTYLPIEKKQTPTHRNFCEKIKVKPWREDCLYLDWSEARLKEKLSRIAATILQVNDGKGPDVLVLNEVENRDVLERLRTEFLKSAGYLPAILIEGKDIRGIDVAMLSRFPLVGEPKLNQIEFKTDNDEDKARIVDTRGILQATFRLPNGENFSALGVHFPNPSHPEFMRTQALQTLSNIRQSLGAGSLVLAAGDFNITSEEDDDLNRFAKLSDEWFVSHRIGCKNCLGTQYYYPKKSWSFLDVMLFSKSLGSDEKAKWRVDFDSIQIVKNYPPQLRPDGTPARFKDEKSEMGVSDHLPIAAKISLNEN